MSRIKRFILFQRKRHPRELGGAEIEAYLTHLAEDRKVAALRPHVKDLDFEMNQILVHDAKRKKDCVTLLPKSVQRDLKQAVGPSARALQPEPSGSRAIINPS